jgi:hypothetical protein
VAAAVLTGIVDRGRRRGEEVMADMVVLLVVDGIVRCAQNLVRRLHPGVYVI